MKQISSNLVGILFLVLLTHSVYALANPPSRTVINFTSSSPEGLIGATEESPIDNPADNIFHVTINEALCAEDKLWLVYDLEGLEDHTSLSRSINDQRSVGGYLVKKRKGWATQREQVSAAWLRQGDNVVRFTMPEGAQHSYRIKNLRVEMEKSTEQEFQLILNQPSKVHYQDKAYVKGFLSGTKNQPVKLKIAGQEVPVLNGEFESIIALASFNATCKTEMEVTHGDGTTTCHAIEFSETAAADYIFTRSSSYKRTEQFFDVSAAQTIQLDGAKLQAEAGSLQASAHLSITSLRDVDIPALDAGMVNVTSHHEGFRFLPHGTAFLKETKLTLPFDQNKIPDGYTEKDIKTYYFDEQAHHWVAMPTDTVLLEGGEVISKAVHFTDYINAIIKVPESPEVEAYNSTSMKGIKAANPTAAVNLINPPQANNTGSASLGYPINIPAGRGGMQPQLSINYNSGGGNGWMGLGWNLTIPSISIDTRWGVPRYDPAKETETYSMNGEMLSPVAHRGELENRSAEKRFYPRVEGSFNKIIRHGNNPTNYYWEVTDKSGTRYFYGGSPAGFDKASVLRTDEGNTDELKKGNVAQWMLSEVRDLNGNTVKYYYDKQADTGLAGGTVPGHQIYIAKITYTGHNGSDGKYSVHFTRDRQPGEIKRQDVSIMANLGFKQVTADLLKKIEVKFNNSKDNIRSYELKYQPGEFYKTLLVSISEFDSKGVLFNTHDMEYFNDVRKGTALIPLDTAKAWTMPGDNVRNKSFITDIGNFSADASALSGNKSFDWSAGLSVSVTLGIKNPTCKSLSIGGNYQFSKSKNEALLSMMDINGDGLSDKVFLDNNGDVKYRPNLMFGAFDPDPKPVTGINDLFREKSTSNSTGLEANGPCKTFSATVNKGWNWTKSTTSAYFTDVNGDQLPDLVRNGIVYFNHINESGNPVFTSRSGDTPSPIQSGSGVTSDIVTQTPAEYEELNQQYPLHDVVRLWKAPYTGTIKVSGAVRLLPSADPDRVGSPADGVRVAIQLRGTQLWGATIGPDDYTDHLPSGTESLSVQKGDRIYFRVGSVDNGSYDQVQWAPVIEYLNQDINLQDANHKPLYRFESEKDFVPASIQKVGAPIGGTVKISTKFIKPKTTDDVLVAVIRNAGDTVLRKFYRWHEQANDSINLTNLHLIEGDQLSFQVIAKTNIDWPAVQWNARMNYTAADDPQYDVVKSPIEAYPVPEYTLHAFTVVTSKAWKVNEDADTLKVKPVIRFGQPINPLIPYQGDLVFSVKKADTLLARRTLKIVNGKLVGDTVLQVIIKKNDNLFIEYHSRNLLLVSGLVKNNALISGLSKDSTITAGLHTILPDFNNNEDIIFGPLYRGWGHFAWRANGLLATSPIVETELKLNEDLKNPKDATTVSNPDDLSGKGMYDPAKDPFIMLSAIGKEKLWRGYDEFVYVKGGIMSSSRMGEDDISAPVVNTAGGGAFGVNKISKSKSGSFSAGAGVGKGFSASGSYSWSNGSSRVITDFIDMNGDRYPDVVTENKVQYTLPTGALGAETISLQKGVQTTETHSEGVTVSGSAILSETKPGTFKIGKAVVSVGTGKNSAGLNGNYAKGDNHVSMAWLDINGDGLPDRVTDAKKVALNTGYGFTTEEDWNFDAIQTGESKSTSAGLGVTFGNGSVSLGVGLSRSDNFTASSLQDMNGDGLPDMVSAGNPIQVRLNTGNGFATPVVWTGAAHISENTSVSESANVAFTFPIYIPVPPITIYINPSSSVGQGASRELSRFTDIDGDGFPDYVTSTKDDNLTVSRSTIGRTNLLKSVKRPLGATFALGYHREGNTYNLPHSTWVLDSVKVFDGFAKDGVDNMLTTFSYENGYYDRHERENYGFQKVITRSHDTSKDAMPVYTQVTQTFHNEDYFKKGLLLTEVMTDAGGNKFVEKENTYELKNVSAEVKFPALAATTQKFYEGQSSPGKSTSTAFGYDAIGNVTAYSDYGDEGDDDNLNATITYHDLDGPYVKGTPKAITVTGNGRTYRRRESVIDSQGNITQIKQFLSESEVATHDMEYDVYGNLTKITRPKNSKGQRLSFSYVYDDVVQTYTEKVSNTYGYSSEAKYDLSFGQLLSSTDLNGNKITYQIDDLGRVTSITGPYENGGANKTIAFEYHPADTVPWALTKHYDPAYPKNFLETAIFVDGLGRVLQTKKDVSIHAGEAKPDVEMMAVSGRVEFDAFGRTTKAWYPVTEQKGPAIISAFNDTKDDVAPTTTTYDVLNRTLNVVLPDKAETKTTYGFAGDRDGKSQFSTKTTDANGKQTEQFTDVRGRVTAVKNYTTEKEIWTSFKYNAINEQIEAMDDLGHTTFSAYDNFGRRTERKHPDAGITHYSYDLAGNLTSLETANLKQAGMVISYAYDYERLTDITYPQNPENNVKYTYGAAGATNNRVGRIVLQEDASGAQEFFYGPLGEVVKNVRTIVLPKFGEQTYVTEWTYDTWNRLTSMVYADGEKVDYTYNVGGLLMRMDGKKKSATFSYVKQLGYDKFEQRVFLAYGNGTKTTYNYEPDRRRLKNMTAQTSAKRLFMDNVYTYDKVNNILSLENKAPVPATNLMGGASQYSYSYDDLYRLTTASGTYKGANEEHAYTLNMSYNSVGGITQKTQNHLKKGVEQKKTTYNLAYTYGEEQPHAPIHIGDNAYTYDANGNQTGFKDDKTGQRRKLMWDEENRIRSVEDNGAIYHYAYDASGERVWKAKSTGQRIFVNGEWVAGNGNMGNYIVYVNPYIVLKSGGYTKHYYIEGQRITSKLGGGWENSTPAAAGNGKVDYATRGQRVFDGIVKNLKFLGADGQILTAGKSGKIPPGQISSSGNTAEAFRYFYHPDHLGSTSYVTDASGEVYQHLEYFAFGETFVEEHSNTDRTPYLFNGKELDEETGLYYYGARYYDSRTSVWLSVDPMMDRYPSLSPYNFSFNNPVIVVDPDGRCPDCQDGKYTIQKGDNFWALEKKWNMKHGSLSAMNKDVDAKKLQIGQDIKTTLNKSDLPEGTQPHSDNSLKGMDGFFKKGADGVNNMVTISEEAYDAIVTSTANTYKSAFENTGKDNWSDNATGGFLDMKKYFLTNMSQYADENTRSDFFKNQTSVTELSARNLYLYKGYAYNINEFGNLMFGSVKAKLGANVRTLIAGGHVYSLFSNGSFDDAKEVEAVKRGFSYYEKK